MTRQLTRFLAAFCAAALIATVCSACGKSGDDTSAVSDVSSDISAPAPTNAEGLTDSERAFSMYEAAMEKYNAKTGIDATLTGTATVTAAGNTTEWTIDASWISQQKEKTEADFVDHLTETLVKGNDVIERDVFYGGGAMYVTQDGQRFRQIVARNTAIGETALFTLPVMTKAAFASPLIVYEKGNTVLSLPMNGDILSDELQNEDGALAYLLGGLNPDATYAFGNITASVSIDENGYLVGFGIYYTVTADDENATTATVSLSIDYDRVGDNITVKLPPASKYKERIGSGLSREAYAVMPEVVDLLFGADGKRVENYDEAYAAACDTYKKALVDEIVKWFENQ